MAGGSKPSGSKKAGSSKPKKILGKRKKRVSMTEKAGLTFSASRVRRQLKAGNYAPRISPGAAVYMAGTLEYLTAEILELAGYAAKGLKKKRINPRCIQLAVRGDEELDKLLKGVTISEGGVIPHIHKSLIPKKKESKKKQKVVQEEEQAVVSDGEDSDSTVVIPDPDAVLEDSE